MDKELLRRVRSTRVSLCTTVVLGVLVAVATIVFALLVTVCIGLAGTWRVLGHKAAPVLRNL